MPLRDLPLTGYQRGQFFHAATPSIGAIVAVVGTARRELSALAAFGAWRALSGRWRAQRAAGRDARPRLLLWQYTPPK